MHVFELNLIRTIEDNETCKIEKEMERVKCEEKMNNLEVDNDEIESDLKNEIKEFAVFNKKSIMRDKKLEEKMHEQEQKLMKIERVNKGLTDHVNHKEIQTNEAERNQRKLEQRQ